MAQQQRTSGSTWGLGDVALWFVVAQVSSLLGASLLLSVTGHEPGATLPLGLVALLQVPLWVGYLAGPLLTTSTKGRGPVAELRARITAADVLPGLLLGVAAQLVAIPALYHLVVLRFVDGDLSGPAQDLVDRADDPLGVLLLVLVAGVGAPLVEEVFYRGFLLRGLARRLGDGPAVVVSSVVFAAVHLQGLQFPALMLFGLLAGWLTVRTGRLGMAWAAHVGFNGATLAVLLLS